MPGAWLVVRATVANAADRPAFDHWYRTEHLPDAMKAFGVRQAWRGWSQQDLQKLASGNLIRVLKASEAYSAAHAGDPPLESPTTF